MTPTQIDTLARQKYNAVGDTFFSSDEMLNYMYAGSMELAREALVIERLYTASSVASQQDYSYPTNTIEIKRVTYAGSKLKQITMREDDGITGNNSATTETGTPRYYFIWNNTFYFRPIPATDGDDIEIFSYNEPQAITTTSTLEIPTLFHLGLVDYVVLCMFMKDQNAPMIDRYQAAWDKTKMEAKKWSQKRKRGDSFAVVQAEENLNMTVLGSI